MALTFDLQPNPNPASDERLSEILAKPGFGDYFTDHMAVATWKKDEGWLDDAVVPYGPFAMDPAAAVFHYGQEIFEGLKAYRHADGSVWLFRPEMNAARMMKSAERLCLPPLPVDDFVAACTKLVEVDQRWVPDPTQGPAESLYLRPFTIAFENFLGVRAAQTALFCVIASPVGPYFANGVTPIDIWVTDEWSRAGVGGTGAAKCGGNYASSLIAQYEGYDQGCQQVLFVQAGRDQVDELGGMNVFVVTKDGGLITPATEGTILHGVTRDSILTVGKSMGLDVQERRLGYSELSEGIASGEFIEAFCCGTAAVISPIQSFKGRSGAFSLPEGAGSTTMSIRNAITDIQFGRAQDPYGWMHRIA